MKERILLLLEHYNLSSAQFAESISVQRSSISHILSGRNNPSYDFIIKILQQYPDISAEWLLLGQGIMIKSQIETKTNQNTQNKPVNQDLFSQERSKQKTISNTIGIDKPKDPVEIKSIKQEEVKSTNLLEITNVNSVESVILVYDNKTFEIIQRK
jgi:plasmid maintenance system antidote protein VapI